MYVSCSPTSATNRSDTMPQLFCRAKTTRWIPAAMNQPPTVEADDCAG